MNEDDARCLWWTTCSELSRLMLMIIQWQSGALCWRTRQCWRRDCCCRCCILSIEFVHSKTQCTCHPADCTQANFEPVSSVAIRGGGRTRGAILQRDIHASCWQTCTRQLFPLPTTQQSPCNSDTHCPHESSKRDIISNATPITKLVACDHKAHSTIATQ